MGAVISPLLSNIYLHVLDTLWMRHCAPLGTLVRYADDFVVICTTKRACEQAEQRIRVILERLGLELHPDKTRRVELFDGKEGFDFLGCHLHERLSGKLLEKKGKRLYFLQRWPSRRSMQRIRQRVKEMTPRAERPFWKQGRNPRAGETREWTRECFENLGLHRLRGTIRYPGASRRRYRSLVGGRVMLRVDRPPVSRVREIRTHGLKGGLAPTPVLGPEGK